MLRFFQLYAIVTYLQAAVRDRPLPREAGEGLKR